MNNINSQQEVLLMMNTSFSSREWAEKNESGQNKPFDEREQWMEGCWNGLVREMLPEVFIKSSDNHDLTLWHVEDGKAFLDLELSVTPSVPENEFSINPYRFLSSLNLN